jgi:hypothetical protein
LGKDSTAVVVERLSGDLRRNLDWLIALARIRRDPRDESATGSPLEEEEIVLLAD